jgi:hypothetical protein
MGAVARSGRSTVISDSELNWFYSYFLTMCVRKTGIEWQQFVTDVMSARHGGAFVQVDPSFSGDEGCDGYVGGLMLAAYGAQRPTSEGVKLKVESDLAKAKANWGASMKQWAFVHNNATGLPLAVIKAVVPLQADEAKQGLALEIWSPQVLWDKTLKDLPRDALVRLIGVPPSLRPAQMSYIATAIRSMARTQLIPGIGSTLPVPEKKIEFNEFEPSTAQLICEYQVHTHLVRYYFDNGTPGEQFQVAESLRTRYDGLAAESDSPDATFHALCDELISEAFDADTAADTDQQRSAALLVITHFFESCLIFKMPEESFVVSA